MNSLSIACISITAIAHGDVPDPSEDYPEIVEPLSFKRL